MKKVSFFILAILFLLSACDKTERYSDEQINALNKLKGNYHAYVGDDMIFAVVSFMARYEMPLPLSEKRKNKTYGHGECFFSDYKYHIPEKGYIPCYYSVSKNADILSFYYKGGENNKSLFVEYTLHIESEDVFTLNDNDRMLRFEKVK